MRPSFFRRVAAALFGPRPARAPGGARRPPSAVLFADLDGTLVEAGTLDPGEAAGALARFRVAGGVLVLVSGKTLPEVLALWQRLALAAPFAIEMGAAVYIPHDHFPALPADVPVRADGSFRVMALRPSRARIVASLAEAAKEADVVVRAFAAMSVTEVAAVTGLSRERAAHAMARRYSEPFSIVEGDPARLEDSLAGRGLRLARGDRFFHAHGPADKGSAARLIARCYRESFGPRLLTAAVGHSPDELPVFQAVDRAFVLPGVAGEHHAESVKAGAMPIAAAGPRGFAMAVDALLLGGMPPPGGSGASGGLGHG